MSGSSWFFWLFVIIAIAFVIAFLAWLPWWGIVLLIVVPAAFWVYRISEK